MRILHIAPLNVAGVPYLFMEMQRRFGDDARLLTLHRNPHGFPEDICLDLPLPRGRAASIWREYKGRSAVVTESAPGSERTPTPILRPRNAVEALFFRYDDLRRRQTVREAVRRYNLDSFDIVHYDGGLDLYRDARLAREWKRQGKKIVCHYMGSDLRIRGVHPVMDALSDLNITNESDHLLLHPNIHYLYIPFDASVYSLRPQENVRLRIVHSPTNRAMKGTELILPVIERLKRLRPVDFVLVENVSHREALAVKETCDLAIEQVGNYGGTGYGRNSLETLAMGIPTVTEMTPDYTAWLPENPFVLATAGTLLDRLLELIDSADLRRAKSREGRRWVEKYHSFESVHTRLSELYREHGIVRTSG